ncbi:MAG: SpoIIE family protein phosphatase [Firmicutes bacterium]|nr:SpoIIE family protein phosphatase [Bacillota bacterium]
MDNKKFFRRASEYAEEVGAKLSAFFGSYLKKYALQNGTPEGAGTKTGVKKTGAAVFKAAPAADGVLSGLGIAAAAFLIGCAETSSGIRPLGTAFAAALGRRAPWGYAGLALSSFTAGNNAFPALVSYMLSFCVRVLLCRYLGKEPFCEKLSFRCANASFSAGAMGLLVIFINGLSVKTALGAASAMLIAPAALLCYCGATDRERRFTLHYEAAVMALLASAVLALKNVYILGFSLASVAAASAVLYITVTGGLLRGAVAGLLCGLVIDPAYAPSFAITGIAAGLLAGAGPIASCAAACCAGAAYGVYAGGIGAFGSIVPDMLCAAAVMIPCLKFKIIPKLFIYSAPSDKSEEAVCAGVITGEKAKDTERRLASLAEAMGSLSEMFAELSGRMRKPEVGEVRRLCDRIWQEKCAKCKLNPVCWEREYSYTNDVLNKLSAAMAANGSVTADDLPVVMQRRCPESAGLTEAFTAAYLHRLDEAAKTDRSDVFSLDLKTLSKLLGEACRENAEEFTLDETQTKKARLAARRCGLYARNIAVYGRRRISVVAGGVDMSKARISSEEIRRSFKEACGTEFAPPRFDLCDDYVTMYLSRQRRLGTDCASATKRKEGEARSGDSCASVESSDDRFYCVISDGMGSGTDAALTSGTVCVFLEKMLSAGNGKGAALEMLNNYMRCRNMECFATVDLLEVDLLTASAAFVKSGAAPSYVVRGGKLFRITSSSLPVGITDIINAEEIRFSLEEGDVIVMMSDGVEDGPWLAELLTFGTGGFKNLDGAAHKIADEAAAHSRRSDDITVCLTKIVRYSG